MDQHYNDEPDNKNKVLDLTFNSQENDEREGPDYFCDHCEIPMHRCDEDLSSATDGSVVVKQGSYYCSKCGMVWDSLDQQQQREMKLQEKTGPRMPKPDFFFESIPSKSGLEPKHIEGFDPEPYERERLESEGCTVMEERITTSDGRTIVKR